MSSALLARIESTAPRRPWCGQYKDGARVRPLKTALWLPYLQINSPAQHSWLQLDIDMEQAAHVWEDCNLPPPTYVAVNPENGHAQYGYALASPVCVTDAARAAPLRFLAAIEFAFNRVAGADRAFRGPLAKNPLHPNWRLWQPANDAVYELSELAEYVELPSAREVRKGRIDIDHASLGRNCFLFEKLRVYAYQDVRKFWRPAGYEPFKEAVLSEAMAVNDTFLGSPGPLSFSEVRSIARSVAKWVWKKFTPAAFRAIQSARGVASGVARREASRVLREEATARAAGGASTREIAAGLGVNQSTISRWLRAKGSCVLPHAAKAINRV
ncbi:replication initiation protein [Bordetella genomosp. 13]|uniref:replication initiation protein n=1 Tax=Bordetella genomosp. 13 TaxID=463040 RepID=UPI00119F503A|nr:replication initiation protein [Bordetella genomosp. 13]